jgi:hypothetical protein
MGHRHDAIILGAGIVGPTAAHIAGRGGTAAIVDRHQPGQGASYGNAGLIEASAVTNFPCPRDIPTISKILLKAAIVSGSTSGIGLPVAHSLAAEGCNVVGKNNDPGTQCDNRH